MKIILIGLLIIAVMIISLVLWANISYYFMMARYQRLSEIHAKGKIIEANHE